MLGSTPRLPSAPSRHRINERSAGSSRSCLHQVRDALRRLAEIVGGEIDFHGGTSHAKIVGVQRGVDEIEQAVGILQMPAPAIDILADDVQRFECRGAMARSSDARLLLGSQAREGIGVSGSTARLGFAATELEGSPVSEAACYKVAVAPPRAAVEAGKPQNPQGWRTAARRGKTGTA